MLNSILLQRLQYAVSTLPSLEDWQQSAWLLGIFVVVTMAVGYPTGYLRFEFPVLSWPSRLSVVVTALFFPGIVEEVLFRVLFLPHPLEAVPQQATWLWGGLSLTVFVLVHPLYGWISRSPGLRQNSQDAVYLFLAGLLGLVCAIAYYQTGSLWSSVVLHWLIVVLWLLVFGGYNRIHA